MFSLNKFTSFAVSKMGPYKHIAQQQLNQNEALIIDHQWDFTIKNYPIITICLTFTKKLLLLTELRSCGISFKSAYSHFFVICQKEKKCYSSRNIYIPERSEISRKECACIVLILTTTLSYFLKLLNGRLCFCFQLLIPFKMKKKMSQHFFVM